VYRSPSVNVYRNPRLLPRATIVHEARGVSSAKDALAALASPDFDPAREVILETARPDRFPRKPVRSPGSESDGSSATLLPSPPNQATIRADLSRPGYLVLADTFYPGWQAYVDGQRVEILRANYAFRALPLDAGEHEVRFQYRPRSFVVGLACSGCALIGALVAWIACKPGTEERGSRRPCTPC
jgi:hypothetical protein